MIKPLVATVALFALATGTAAQTVPTQQVGSATLSGVPNIPVEVREAVQRYQNSRAAQFEDWLPDGSMLIATRFGATQQLHHVATPGGARTQITFGAEPIAAATTIPRSDRFVMTRDTGGDEWFQLYTRGLTGVATPVTEAGTRNQSPVFSKDGALMAWARATKGSAAYAILGVDPKAGGNPRSLY